MSFPIRNFYVRFLASLMPITKRHTQFVKMSSHAIVTLNMNEAILFHEEGSRTFEMQIRYINPVLKIDRQFNFERRIDECVKDFLWRMEVNINSHLIKKIKRKNKQRKKNEIFEENIVNIENGNIKFLKDHSTLDGELTCRTILENLSDIKLIIFDTEYVLKQNIPYVTKIKLPSNILIDYPTYPCVLETRYTDETKSIFNWYKSKGHTWVHVGNGFLYTPNENDLGCKLKISCVPKSDTQSGPMIETVSKNVVQPGPGLCPFHIRHTYTKNKLSGKSFRVTSYNILSDIYSKTTLSKEILYPYCPSYALSMDYRKPLILKELIGYNTDIICLQEVDATIYEKDLLRSLMVMNYDGIYNNKNQTCEGLAIFYNRDRFEKLSSDYSVIGHSAELDEFNTVWLQIRNNNVKQSFQNKNTIIQVAILRSKENAEILIVGNTHLHFRPDADHIRLLQAYYGLLYLRSFAKKMREAYPECTVSILYCGDFNSTPENAVYQLMTQKYIPEDHVDWKSCPEECVENVAIKHDSNLSSACGTPKYTNYTATFSGCLDYIFYQTDYLDVEQIIPMPSSKELGAHTGLPSLVCPSDHISLCVDLKWSK